MRMTASLIIICNHEHLRKFLLCRNRAKQNKHLLVVGSSARKHKAKTNMAQATSLSLCSRFIGRWNAMKITSTSWFVQFWSKSSKCNVCGASTAMIISFQEKILSRDSRCHNISSAAFWEGLSTRCCGYEQSFMPDTFWH